MSDDLALPSARALATSLLSAAFAAEGGPPSQLSEEDFLAAEASVIADGRGAIAKALAACR